MAGVIIGVDNLTYAILTSDPKNGTAAYTAPVLVPGLIEANINPNSSMETLFADNGPMEVATALGAIEFELNQADLPLEVQAVLLGHTIDANGILIRKDSDIPPWVAIGFRSLKSNGKYRYVWLSKGKFSQPEQNNQTKTDGVEFQTPTISANFVRREADGVWIKQTDEDLPSYKAAIGTAWFNAVL